MKLIGIAALALIGVWAIVAAYRRQGLSPLRLRWYFTPDRIGPGERGTFTLRVDHLGALPLGWVRVTVPMPRGLVLPGLGLEGLVLRMRPRPGRAVVRHYPFTAPERGYYRVDGTSAETGDPLGFTSFRDTVPGAAQLLVYPRLVDLTRSPRSAALIAEMERPSLLEDPTLIAGVRPYMPGDPLKRVHWPQTARTGELMSRVYPPSTRLSVWVVLNLATEEPHWLGIDGQAMEDAISRAASLARQLLADGIPAGLLVNGVAFEATAITRLGPGAGAQQLPAIMELLGRLAPYPSAGADALLRQAAALPDTHSVLVVSPCVPPSWRVLLPQLAATRIVHVDLPEGEDPPALPGMSASLSRGDWRGAARRSSAG